LDVRSKNSIKRSLNKESIIKSINKYFGINPGKCSGGAEIEKVFKKNSANELQNFFYAMKDEIIRKKLLKEMNFYSANIL